MGPLGVGGLWWRTSAKINKRSSSDRGSNPGYQKYTSVKIWCTDHCTIQASTDAMTFWPNLTGPNRKGSNPPRLLFSNCTSHFAAPSPPPSPRSEVDPDYPSARTATTSLSIPNLEERKASALVRRDMLLRRISTYSPPTQQPSSWTCMRHRLLNSTHERWGTNGLLSPSPRPIPLGRDRTHAHNRPLPPRLTR